MKKIIASVILSILAMDISGFSPQAFSVVIVKRPVLRERVIVRKVVPPVVVAPVVPAIPRSGRLAYCRNHIPPYVAAAEVPNWVARCARFEARPM